MKEIAVVQFGAIAAKNAKPSRGSCSIKFIGYEGDTVQVWTDG